MDAQVCGSENGTTIMGRGGLLYGCRLDSQPQTDTQATNGPAGLLKFLSLATPTVIQHPKLSETTLFLLTTMSTSTSEAPVKADNLNEIGDSVAAMVACVLQEQLAPILEAVREHSRLLDWHSALLNHSTLVNRYNVGKLEDLRDLQTNVK